MADNSSAKPAAKSGGAKSLLHADGETRLEDQVSRPATTAPGDAPADTTDPQPDADAIRVGTVNSNLPLEPIKPVDVLDGDDEFEEYKATAPGGAEVTVRHSLITGKSELV
jgi:hypothetical protein